jgi:hypothetical protein
MIFLRQLYCEFGSVSTIVFISKTGRSDDEQSAAQSPKRRRQSFEARVALLVNIAQSSHGNVRFSR